MPARTRQERTLLESHCLLRGVVAKECVARGIAIARLPQTAGRCHVPELDR